MISDFVSTEYAFAYLQKEGYRFDALIHADVFRSGDPKLIGKILQETADILQKRTETIDFEPWEKIAGKPHILLESGIKSLREIGKAMENWKNRGKNDKYWILIGELIRIISALLDHTKGVKED